MRRCFFMLLRADIMPVVPGVSASWPAISGEGRGDPMKVQNGMFHNLVDQVAQKMIPGQAGRVAGEILNGMVGAAAGGEAEPAAVRAFAQEFAKSAEQLAETGQRLSGVLQQANGPGGVVSAALSFGSTADSSGKIVPDGSFRGMAAVGLPPEAPSAGKATPVESREGETKVYLDENFRGWMSKLSDESKALTGNMDRLVRHSRELAANMATGDPGAGVAGKPMPELSTIQCTVQCFGGDSQDVAGKPTPGVGLRDLLPMVRGLQQEIAVLDDASRLAGGILEGMGRGQVAANMVHMDACVGEYTPPAGAAVAHPDMNFFELPFQNAGGQIDPHAAGAELENVMTHVLDFREALIGVREQVNQLASGLSRAGAATDHSAPMLWATTPAEVGVAGRTTAGHENLLDGLSRFTDSFTQAANVKNLVELPGLFGAMGPPDFDLAQPLPGALRQRADFDDAADFGNRANLIQTSQDKLTRLNDSLKQMAGVAEPAAGLSERLDQLNRVMDDAVKMNQVLSQRFQQFRF
jgi:hypothetical protein